MYSVNVQKRGSGEVSKMYFSSSAGFTVSLMHMVGWWVKRL